MGFYLEKLVNGLKTAPQNFRAIVKTEIQDWKTLPARVEEVNQFNKTKPKNMETKKLSRRDFLKISGIGSVAVTLVACGGEIGRRIVTPDQNKNQEPTYLGIVYNSSKKVFGFGDVSGDKIPTSKDLYGMALSGVQFEQTSPNSWTDVTPQLSMVIQGVNGANVIHDNEGRPLGGFYLNKAGMAQFMTRFGESLIFLSPDPNKVTKNSDSSITVISHMVTRNDTGKWGLEPVEIPITLRFDAFGNVVAYDIPLLSSATPGATPTPSAEQKANFLVPREIAFRPTAVGMTATKEPLTNTPTATNTPTETATPAPSATSTSRPTSTQAPTNRPPEATATPKPDNPRLPGTPDILPDGSYPLGNDNILWTTPPMVNNLCKELPDKFWFSPTKIKYDSNKNLPWGETRYVCTYNTQAKNWEVAGKIIYDPKP